MNKKQKRILRITAAVILLMLLFPPAHYVGNKSAHGSAGYIFILSPESGVDVSFGLLLTQWVGVIVVAALMWFLSMGQDAVQPSAHSEMKADHEDIPLLPNLQGQEALYSAFIGAKKSAFYLPRFKLFDERGRVVPTWNWAACICGAAWFGYRKMYLWALVSYLLPTFFLLAARLLLAVDSSGASTVVGAFAITVITLLGLYVLLPTYANGLYYRHARRQIVKIVRRTSNSSQHQLLIEHLGGVNKWVIWLFGLLGAVSLASIVATVAILSIQPKYEPNPQAAVEKDLPRDQWETIPPAAPDLTPAPPVGIASAPPSEQIQEPDIGIPVDEAEATADWHNIANWRMLKEGKAKANVRRILGEPLKIDRSSGMEYWYYTSKGILGPHIWFYDEKVAGWEEP